MAVNMSFFKKIFGESGLKEAQKTEFISVLEQIDRNDAQALKTYLNQNKKMLVQQFGPEKYSLLHWACFQLENDSLCSEIVEFLLQQQGVKVNQQDSNGQTPLHIAAQQHLLCPEDSTHTIKLLIEKDADPIFISSGRSCLSRKYQWGHDASSSHRYRPHKACAAFNKIH